MLEVPNGAGVAINMLEPGRRPFRSSKQRSCIKIYNVNVNVNLENNNMNYKVVFLSKDMTESWNRFFETLEEATKCFEEYKAQAKFIAIYDCAIQQVF
jgi:hypothetical protein